MFSLWANSWKMLIFNHKTHHCMLVSKIELLHIKWTLQVLTFSVDRSDWIYQNSFLNKNIKHQNNYSLCYFCNIKEQITSSIWLDIKSNAQDIKGSALRWTCIAWTNLQSKEKRLFSFLLFFLLQAIILFKQS